ncbi:hypothetical protein B0H17DRAFT_1123474 [Mycena rosella]|uniref:AAA domain-containing protein n=1 Tax=Mycena rosella TaxID=1033263 RepID=A0AAD7AWA2_MYCRO|nr:hypothetical protein B0H17DRAFT_1123474 [Mycena rosella]
MARRHDTVRGIVEQLRKVNFIQLRGSPASGKTILLHLIQQHLESEGKIVERLDKPWPTDEMERRGLHVWLRTLRDKALENSIETVVLIDEGQASYGDFTLWNSYFKAWTGDITCQFRILIACAWGSVTPHAMTSGWYPKIVLEEQQKIGLRPSPTSPFGLLFINPKWRNLQSAIFELTAGYASVVVAILRAIGAKIEALIRKQKSYSLEDFRKEWHPPEELFETLAANGPCLRFLPKGTIAEDPRVVRVFKRLFVDGPIEYREGDEYPGGLDRDDLDFVHQKGATPVNAPPPVPDGLADTPSLFSLVTEVIRMFNPDHLASPRRVGATYQHEFYRCLYEVRPKALISAEYGTRAGQTPTGRIRFSRSPQGVQRWGVDEPRSWGIELH